MSFDYKNYSYNNKSFESICFAIKAWVAGFFFILQAINPQMFTCISTGIIKDMAFELDSKYVTNKTIETSTNTQGNEIKKD